MKMKNFMLLSALSILTVGILISSHTYALDVSKPVTLTPGTVANLMRWECKKIDVNCSCSGGNVTGTFGATGVRVSNVTGDTCSGIFEIASTLNHNAEELCSDGTFGYVYSGMDMGECEIDWECAVKCN